MQVWAAPSAELTSVAITTAAVVLGAGAAFWAVSLKTRVALMAEEMRRRLQGYAARTELAEAAARAVGGLALIWPEAGDPDSTPPGPNHALGDAEPLTRLLDGFDWGNAPAGAILARLGESLAPASAAALHERRVAFEAAGTPFTLRVRTSAGEDYALAASSLGSRICLSLAGVPLGPEAPRPASPDRSHDALVPGEALPFPLWRRDEKNRLVWVNDAFARAAGLPSPAAALAARTSPRKVLGERRGLRVEETDIETGRLGYALPQGGAAPAPIDTALDCIPTAVAHFDGEGRLKLHNPAFADLWSLEPDWLSEGPSEGDILDRLRETRRLPEQSDFLGWKQARAERAKIRTAPEEEMWHLPDGRTIRVHTQPHREGGTLTVYEDVTNLFALQSSLNALTKVQRATLDTLREAVAAFGSDGRLKLSNAAFATIWGLEPEDLVAGPHFSHIVERCGALFDNAAEWARIGERVTAVSAERNTLSARIERTDGKVLDYAVIPLPDGGTLLTFVDVTDSLRIERALRDRNEALEAADRLKSEFIAHVSYQLRTPLNSILGFTQMLEKGHAGTLETRQRDYVENILTASEDLESLVTDILDLAMVEAGTISLEIGAVRVKDLVEYAGGYAAAHAGENGLTLEVTCPDDLGTIQADERRLKQVLANLVSNALRFTPPGGKVSIGAERSGKGIKVSVSDTGSGIASGDQPHVFDRFETRSGSKPGGPRRGAGLGLALVKSFVDLHGGWVSLESEPGQGTRVVCYLPERAQSSETAAA